MVLKIYAVQGPDAVSWKFEETVEERGCGEVKWAASEPRSTKTTAIHVNDSQPNLMSFDRETWKEMETGSERESARVRVCTCARWLAQGGIVYQIWAAISICIWGICEQLRGHGARYEQTHDVRTLPKFTSSSHQGQRPDLPRPAHSRRSNSNEAMPRDSKSYMQGSRST